MATSDYDLIERLFEVAGADLIAVARYDGDAVDLQYAAGEAFDAVPQEQAERIHRELVLEQLSVDYLEAMFELGALEDITLHFEDGIVVNLVGSDTNGVFVLTTPGVDVAAIRAAASGAMGGRPA